jgi:hypothetical protein
VPQARDQRCGVVPTSRHGGMSYATHEGVGLDQPMPTRNGLVAKSGRPDPRRVLSTRPPRANRGMEDLQRSLARPQSQHGASPVLTHACEPSARYRIVITIPESPQRSRLRQRPFEHTGVRRTANFQFMHGGGGSYERRQRPGHAAGGQLGLRRGLFLSHSKETTDYDFRSAHFSRHRFPPHLRLKSYLG